MAPFSSYALADAADYCWHCAGGRKAESDELCDHCARCATCLAIAGGTVDDEDEDVAGHAPECTFRQ